MANRKGAGGTAQAVEALVRPVVEAMGLCIWDVRFEKEGPDWFLRIYLDGGGRPLDMEACEAATRAINPVLDEADPISQSYYLEVGSPGLGRRLTRDEHFTAKRGERCAHTSSGRMRRAAGRWPARCWAKRARLCALPWRTAPKPCWIQSSSATSACATMKTCSDAPGARGAAGTV